MNNRNFKGIWIPKQIWLDKTLTPLEKIYLAEIDSLDDEIEGCFASNKHFEELFGQKSANATRIITNLKEKGWINIEYEYNGKEISKRIIKCNRPPYPNRYYKNDNTYYKNDNGVLSKLEGGYYKNDNDRYTLLIDKHIDNKKKNIKKKYFENEELNNLFLEFLELRKKLKAVNSDRAINLLINKLNNYDDDIKIMMINQSIVNSWKSVYEIKKNKNKENFMDRLDKWAKEE